jgi:hypothetical protein
MEFGEIGQLLGEAHLRIEAAFLGHVTDPAASLGGKRSLIERDLALVGRQHAQHDPHRGRLA